MEYAIEVVLTIWLIGAIFTFGAGIPILVNFYIQGMDKGIVEQWQQKKWYRKVMIVLVLTVLSLAVLCVAGLVFLASWIVYIYLKRKEWKEKYEALSLMIYDSSSSEPQ